MSLLNLKNNYLYLIIAPISILLILVIFLTIQMQNTANSSLELYTTISDPKDFNYGANIDSTREYSVHICWKENLTKNFLNPRFVVVYNGYFIDGKDSSDIDVLEYERESIYLNPKILSYFSVDSSYSESLKTISYYCNLDLSSNGGKLTISELIKFKQDAQNPPQIDYNDPAIQQKIKDAQNFNNPTPEELEKINKDFNTR